MVLRSISFHVASELQTYWTQNYGFSTISFMFYFTLQRYKTTLAMVSPQHFEHIERKTYGFCTISPTRLSHQIEQRQTKEEEQNG